jgi:hypothetical protein
MEDETTVDIPLALKLTHNISAVGGGGRTRGKIFSASLEDISADSVDFFRCPSVYSLKTVEATLPDGTKIETIPTVPVGLMTSPVKTPGSYSRTGTDFDPIGVHYSVNTARLSKFVKLTCTYAETMYSPEDQISTVVFKVSASTITPPSVGLPYPTVGAIAPRLGASVDNNLFAAPTKIQFSTADPDTPEFSKGLQVDLLFAFKTSAVASLDSAALAALYLSRFKALVNDGIRNITGLHEIDRDIIIRKQFNNLPLVALSFFAGGLGYIGANRDSEAAHNADIISLPKEISVSDAKYYAKFVPQIIKLDSAYEFEFDFPYSFVQPKVKLLSLKPGSVFTSALASDAEPLLTMEIPATASGHPYLKQDLDVKFKIHITPDEFITTSTLRRSEFTDPSGKIKRCYAIKREYGDPIFDDPVHSHDVVIFNSTGLVNPENFFIPSSLADVIARSRDFVTFAYNLFIETLFAMWVKLEKVYCDGKVLSFIDDNACTKVLEWVQGVFRGLLPASLNMSAYDLAPVTAKQLDDAITAILTSTKLVEDVQKAIEIFEPIRLANFKLLKIIAPLVIDEHTLEVLDLLTKGRFYYKPLPQLVTALNIEPLASFLPEELYKLVNNVILTNLNQRIG